MRSQVTSTPIVAAALVVAPLWGCVQGGESNPFQTFTEVFGTAARQTQVSETPPAGVGAGGAFRSEITLTFRNNHPRAEVNTQFVAWVSQASLRSIEQQDALLRNGYVQLREEVWLGTAHRLPVGTFVYGGGGVAGATALVLERAGVGEDAPIPSEMSFTLRTPDAIVVFSHPPVGCDSVAFYYTDDGIPLATVPVVGGSLAPFEGSTRGGPFKTLAMVDVYDCAPLRPGVFFTQSGAARRPNEYLEGEPVTFDFNPLPTEAGHFAIVTIGVPEDENGGG